MSRAGSLQEEFVRAKLSNFVIMDWTDGKLYHTNRATGRRGKGSRRQPKEVIPQSRLRPPTNKALSQSLVDFYSVPPGPHSFQPQHFQPGGPSDHGAEAPAKKTAHSAIYENLPTTVEEFLKEWKSERTIGTDASHAPIHDDKEKIEKLNQIILTRPSMVPPRPPPMVTTKKRRLRETKITDMEEFKRQRRETLSHIAKGRQELRRMLNSGPKPPQRQDVRIRIGSQEKRLGATSTNITISSQAAPKFPPGHTRAHQSPVPSLGKQSSDRESSVASRRKRTKRRLSRTSSSYPTERSDEPEVRSRILTHSPMIHSPAPKRHTSKYFSLSDNYDSQDANSAVVQPAQAVPPIPSSQRSENSIWRGWFESASGAAPTDRGVEGSMGSIQWPPVSPGISEAFRLPKEATRRLPVPPDSAPDEPDQPSHNACDCSDELLSSGSSFIVQRHDDLSDSNEAERYPVDVEDTRRNPPDSASQLEWAKNGGNMYEITAVSPRAQASDSEPQVEDPEEAWKAFVLMGADSDDIEQAAFEEAKHDAAMTIRPSAIPSVDKKTHISDTVSNAATIGTVYSDSKLNYEQENMSEESDESVRTYDTVVETVLASSPREAEPSTDNYEGPEELSTSSADPIISDPSYETSDAIIPASTMEVQVSSSSSLDTDAVLPSTEPTVGNSVIPSQGPSSSLSEPQPNSISSDLNSAIVEPPKSEVIITKPKKHFRFAPPKLFVGSLSSLQPRRPTPAQMVGLAQKKRGRPKKRASDGRADIRALPNHSSDPIEEIEDDVEDSRFGPLELESS